MLVLFNRPSAAQYLSGARSLQPHNSHAQYYRANSSGQACSATRHASRVIANKDSDSTTELQTIQSSQGALPNGKNAIHVNEEVWVENKDVSKVDEYYGEEEQMGRNHWKAAGDNWA